ncbi:hypothetical protein DNTS_021849, partial [Danionella cerebrum]
MEPFFCSLNSLPFICNRGSDPLGLSVSFCLSHGSLHGHFSHGQGPCCRLLQSDESSNSDPTDTLKECVVEGQRYVEFVGGGCLSNSCAHMAAVSSVLLFSPLAGFAQTSAWMESTTMEETVIWEQHTVTLHR